MLDDTRGATSPMSYALTIAIATILITGLVVAAMGHVSDQRSRTTQAQMDVVAQQVAGSLEAADRLVRADAGGDPGTLELERNLPKQILGTGYSVEITSSAVTVSSPLSDRDVRVAYHSQTQVVGSTVRGGRITVSCGDYDATAGDKELEVHNG